MQAPLRCAVVGESHPYWKSMKPSLYKQSQSKRLSLMRQHLKEVDQIVLDMEKIKVKVDVKRLLDPRDMYPFHE